MLIAQRKVVSLVCALAVLGVAVGFCDSHVFAEPSAVAAEKPDPRTKDGPDKKSGAHYCRLVFGRKASVSALVRLDGDALSIDRDGDGKFSGKGEQFKSEEEVKDVTIADPDGKTSYVITYVHVAHVIPPEKFIAIRVHVKGPVQYHQEGFLQMAEGQKDAPVAYFHGPLTVGAKTWTIRRGPKGKELVSDSTLPASLKRVGETELDVHVYREARDSVVLVCSPDSPRKDRRRPPLPRGVHPFADVEFPAKKPGSPPIKRRYALDRDRGDGGFQGAVRVPEEAGLGKARVTFSFHAWKGAKVATTSAEIPIVEPSGKKTLREK